MSIGLYSTALVLTTGTDWMTVKDGAMTYKHAGLDSFGIGIGLFKYLLPDITWYSSLDLHTVSHDLVLLTEEV